MKNINNFALNQLKIAKLNRVRIAKCLMGIAVILLLSGLVEYFWFGGAQRASFGQETGTIKIEDSQISAENFTRDNVGQYVSQADNAKIIIDTQRIYINNLEVYFTDGLNASISVKYDDSKTGQVFELQNKLANSLQKNKLTFLNFAVFRIQSSPAKIEIITPKAQTTINQIAIDNVYHFNFYRFIFIFAVSLLIFIIWMIRKEIGAKPELGFLAIALIAGTLLAFSELRTYVSWDEFIHFQRADDYSLKSIVNGDVSDIYGSTNSVPASYAEKEQKALDQNFDHRPEKIGKNKSKKNFWQKFSLVGFYNGIAYIPSGVALLFGRIFFMPEHIVFMLGRWINVWLYTFVVYFAIRKLKSGKMIMSVVALFPTSIFLASNYNYDSWVNAFTLLALAYLFSQLQLPDKQITKKDLYIIFGAFIIGLAPKAIYFPLMFLLFFLRPSKFKAHKQYKKFICATILSILFVLGSFMLPFVVTGPGHGDKRGGAEVNAVEQVKFILHEPVAYSKILLKFMKDYVNPINAEGFTNFFAYLGMTKGFWLIFAALVLVMFADKNVEDKQTVEWKFRFAVCAIYFATVSLICTALYVSFTALKSNTIAGVQPRYLIPLVFPVLFVLGSWKLKNPINKNFYNGAIFAIMAFVLLQGIWDTIIKFYY